jgi:DhnA family fructose-bisphosphate aldolase class Ia
MALTVGSREQARLLADLSSLVKQADAAGMPVIVHAYPCGELVPQSERFSVSRVAYAVRLAMELGVDIVKTFYTGSAEGFAEVVKTASPALVVAAGGARLETDAQVLEMARSVVRAGGAGITFGRNVWQSKDIPGMIRALKREVHGEPAA